VSLEDGNELWMAETGAEIYDSTPALGEQHLCIGCVNGVTSFIHMADGAIHAQYRLPAGHFLSSPATNGKTFYCATYSDQLFAINLR